MKTEYKTGYHRANRAGAMLMVMTLCQYGIPALFLRLLRAFGVDVEARCWGLTSAAYLCLYLLMYLLMMGIPLIVSACLLMPKARRLSPLNLSIDRRLCVVLCGVALCMIANAVAAVFSGALYQAGVPEPRLPQLGDGSVMTLLMDLIVFALVPAVVEETLLRGLVLQTLRPLGNGIAVAVSALLFGLMHGNVNQTPYALLMGLVLGIVFVYTDDLCMTVTVHALANALAVVSGFLLQFYDAAFASFWQLVILIVVLMMGGVAAFWLWQHPLERRRVKLDTPFTVRAATLFKAPFLWGAFLLMTVLMIARVGAV